MMVIKTIKEAIQTIDQIENVTLDEKLALVVASLVMENYIDKYLSERE